jgi:hypothetical protein
MKPPLLAQAVLITFAGHCEAQYLAGRRGRRIRPRSGRPTDARRPCDSIRGRLRVPSGPCRAFASALANSRKPHAQEAVRIYPNFQLAKNNLAWAQSQKAVQD